MSYQNLRTFPSEFSHHFPQELRFSRVGVCGTGATTRCDATKRCIETMACNITYVCIQRFHGQRRAWMLISERRRRWRVSDTMFPTVLREQHTRHNRNPYLGFVVERFPRMRMLSSRKKSLPSISVKICQEKRRRVIIFNVHNAAKCNIAAVARDKET